MSKAILVLDWMPENCRMCLYGVDYDKHRSLVFCSLESMYMDISKDRASYCPLKEVPEHALIGDRYDDDYNLGYNAALDEILGGDTDAKSNSGT